MQFRVLYILRVFLPSGPLRIYANTGLRVGYGTPQVKNFRKLLVRTPPLCSMSQQESRSEPQSIALKLKQWRLIIQHGVVTIIGGHLIEDRD